MKTKAVADIIDLQKSIIADLDRYKESLQRWETGRYSMGETD